ncbi:uncharacterized protein [Magallana gigas]|uniref:uncharacterized protein n=1 Tax=Magallana gigas TaxID=29159 RepID=UPI00333EA926
MSGMQPVHDLADYLLQLRTLTRTQQEQLVVLWDNLEPQDQRPAVFQSGTRSSPKGRFMASKTGKSPVKANVEKTKRSFVGTGTGPASYPDANRYMEALVKRLTEVYPSAIRRPDAPTITRWSLIQAAYNRIREVVMEDPRVSALTGIQLLPLNQATLILWDRRRQARQEEVVLSQGIEISDPPVTAPQPLPPPLSKPATLVTSSAPAHRYQLPPNTAGQSRVRIRSPPRMLPQLMPSPPRIIRHPILGPAPVQYRYLLTQVPPNQTPQPAILQYQERSSPPRQCPHWFLLPRPPTDEKSRRGREWGSTSASTTPAVDQASAASAKSRKLPPATGSTSGTGTARRPEGRATRTGPTGCASGDTPAGRGDSPRQTKRTRQLIRLDNKTLKKTKKTTYTPRKKKQHQNFEKKPQK